MKYCKVISAVMGSILLFIMVSVFVPIYADAQDFDKPVAADIDEIITEYPAALFQLHLLLRPLHILQRLVNRKGGSFESGITSVLGIRN